jgi:branched-chain amino acid transport system permease protein
LILLALLFLAAPFSPSWLLFLFTVAFAKGLVVLGVVLLLRANLVSFGHGLYFAAGAYGVAIALKNGVPVREALLLVLIGFVVGTALAALIGLFLARYRGIFFGMLSTAFTMILYSLLVKLRWLSGGTDGLGIRASTFAGLETDADTVRIIQYYFVLAIVALAFFVAYRVSHSPLGYLMRAIYDNEIRVEYMGASVRGSIYRTYLLSGMLGGLGGGLTAMSVGHISPDLAYWTSSGEFVFVALLGGTGSVFAPLIGATVFEFVRNYAQAHFPTAWQLLLGSVLLVIILFAPGGLWSLIERLIQGRRRTPDAVEAPSGERRWALSWRR